MAVATGMRLKEITGLCWDDVDRASGLIHVPMDSKTGTRAIPINRTAAEVLDKCERRRFFRSRFVFVSRQGQDYQSRTRRHTISYPSVPTSMRHFPL